MARVRPTRAFVRPTRPSFRPFVRPSDLTVCPVCPDRPKTRLGGLWRVFVPSDGLGEARKSVGLSDEGVAAFRDELLAKGLSPAQAAYACRFAESIRRDGMETRAAIAQSFPGISSVFDASSFDKVWESLKARKA